MKEGTKSLLFGCHNPIMHGTWVLLTWRIQYKSWPKWWQIICIYLHDIGIWGRQYLSDDNAKKGHWELGAWLSSHIVWHIAGKRRRSYLFHRSYKFCAGHCPSESQYQKSKLFMADKRSWVVAPMWWLWWNYWVEWSGNGVGVTPPPLWKKIVAENIKKEEPIESHDLYIKYRKEKP